MISRSIYYKEYQKLAAWTSGTFNISNIAKVQSFPVHYPNIENNVMDKYTDRISGQLICHVITHCMEEVALESCCQFQILHLYPNLNSNLRLNRSRRTKFCPRVLEFGRRSRRQGPDGQ